MWTPFSSNSKPSTEERTLQIVERVSRQVEQLGRNFEDLQHEFSELRRQQHVQGRHRLRSDSRSWTRQQQPGSGDEVKTPRVMETPRANGQEDSAGFASLWLSSLDQFSSLVRDQPRVDQILSHLQTEETLFLCRLLPIAARFLYVVVGR